MPEQRSVDEVAERVRAVVTTAQYAGNNIEYEAAIAGIVRIMNRDGDVLSRYGAAIDHFKKDPDPIIVDHSGTVARQQETINSLIREKHGLKSEIDGLQRLNAESQIKMDDLKERNIRLMQENRRLLKEQERISAPALTAATVSANPSRVLPETWDHLKIASDMDKILSPIKIVPSKELQDVLKLPGLNDRLTHLFREQYVEFAHITLAQDVFAQIYDLFKSRQTVKKAQVAGWFITGLLISEPYDELNDAHKRIWAEMRKWPDIRKNTAIPPWAAFAIRAGVIQDNLRKLVNSVEQTKLNV